MVESERYTKIGFLGDSGQYFEFEAFWIYKCNDCGALVSQDQSPHDFFHDELNEAVGAKYEFNADND